jgi:hypothetical protein
MEALINLAETTLPVDQATVTHAFSAYLQELQQLLLA